MNRSTRPQRPLEGLLVMALVVALAVGFIGYVYVGFVAPAFAKVSQTFEQVQNATEAR